MSCNRPFALDGKLYWEDINFLCHKYPGIQKPMFLRPKPLLLGPNLMRLGPKPMILGPDHIILGPNPMILQPIAMILDQRSYDPNRTPAYNQPVNPRMAPLVLHHLNMCSSISNKDKKTLHVII